MNVYKDAITWVAIPMDRREFPQKHSETISCFSNFPYEQSAKNTLVMQKALQ